MATQRMTRQEKAQWRRLYDLADRLDRLSPWSWMSVADCFGLLFHGMEEPCFVIMGGQPKTFRHIRVLRGWKAFYDLMSRLSDTSRQTPAWLLEIPMFELLFIDEGALFEHERELFAAIKRLPDAGANTPVFRSIRPGYHPWLPDGEERTLLESALYQAFGMAMRVESDGMLLKSRFPREILLRKQDAQGEWHDAWQPVKQIADEEVEVHIGVQSVRDLATKPLWPVTVQIDLVLSSFVLAGKEKRPQTVYVLMVVDAVSGLPLAEETLSAVKGIAQMWSELPVRLLDIFTRLGGCPETIEVGSDRMANLLRPLGEMIPFKMVRRERLATLEKAREKIGESMRSQEPEVEA